MIGFDGDGNVMGGPGNIADAAVGTEGAMEGATASEGLGNVTNANPTFDFVADKPISPQIAKQKSFLNQLKDVLSLSPTRMAMSLLANAVGNPPNEMMSQVTLDQGLRDQYSGLGTSLATDMGHPHTGGPMLGSPAFANESMMSVPMSGFGAQLGIATARDPHTGLNMGPGRPGEPGDVNPFSGVAYADPGDPYIRKKRGTEIVGMIGP